MKRKDVERFSAVCRGFLRPRRACSISRLLLLSELWGGELSSLALERRLRHYGLVNPRVLLKEDAEGLIRRLERVDGVYWVLSERGRLVLTEAVRRMYNKPECVGSMEAAGGGDAQVAYQAELPLWRANDEGKELVC